MVALLGLLSLLQGCAYFAGPGSDSRPSPGSRPVVLWVDWAGTGERLRDPSLRNRFCQAARASGVTHLAIEARSQDGQEVFSNQQGLIAAAKSERLGVMAALPLFIASPDDPAEWTSREARWNGSQYELAPLYRREGFPRLLSPACPEVVERELKAIEELASEPDVQTIILSGLGFGSVLADAGPCGRRAFEGWLGTTLKQWPGALTGASPPDFPYSPEGRGPLWDAWIAWRALVMKDFLLSARTAIAMAAPESPPGLAGLADGPYQVHQRQGWNWAVPEAEIEQDHPWLPAEYSRTSSGHLVRAVALGFWEPGLLDQKKAESAGYAWWASVEGTMLTAKAALPDDSSMWGAVEISEDANWPAAIERIRRRGGGVIVLAASDLLDRPEGFQELRLALGR